jgi:outer membrane protein assembly factor BamB
MSIPARILPLLAILLLTLGCSQSGGPLPASIGGSAGEGDWPTFHGPRRDNISHETGLLTEWPSAGPELIWAAQNIGYGYATVSIADGAVYTTGNLDNQTVVTSLSLDGTVRWQAPAGQAWTGSHEGSRSTPTIDGDRVYCGSPHGEIVCLQADSGQPVWQVNILERFGGRNITWGLAESPLIDGDLVFCTPGGSQGRVAALDKMTGETIWATQGGQGAAGYASAVIAEIHGTRVVLTMSGKSLLGVDAADGRLLFEFPMQTSYDVHATTPICVDNHVFISAGYGTGSFMLRIERDGQNFRAVEKWSCRELDNQHGGIVLWDGFLYGAADQSGKKKWICLGWETGEVRYAEKGVGKGSVLCVEGMLYTLSEKSRMGLVRATPDGHDVISKFSLPRGGDGPSWAHPVVCGGCLYLRHGDRLYCYDVRQPAAAAPESSR